MTDEYEKTVKIRRRPKVATDERGHTVWVEPVDSANLELVSTQRLKKIIADADGKTKDQLRKVAEGEDGLLAQDLEKGKFEIITDDELQKILEGTDNAAEAKDAARVIDEPVAESVNEGQELDLVSTQMLRAILLSEDEEEDAAKGSRESGFNPYDHS